MEGSFEKMCHFGASMKTTLGLIDLNKDFIEL